MDLIKFFGSKTLADAYEAGFDCGKNGANITNCDFKFFSTPQKTAAWERGKKAGEEKRNNIRIIEKE